MRERRIRIRTNAQSGQTTLRSAFVSFRRLEKLTHSYRFIDSEADLDIALKALLPLAQYPVIAYPEIVSSGAVTRFVGLLSHENPDIVIDVVEVINELTDEDVGNEADEDDEAEGSREEALKNLIEGLVSVLAH